MGRMGDEIAAILDKVVEATDADGGQRDDMEDLIYNDPPGFAAAYDKYLNAEEVQLLGGIPRG